MARYGPDVFLNLGATKAGLVVGYNWLFGISYAIASIGCTLPIFMAVLFGGLFVDNGFVAGTLGVAIYGLGMGLVLTALTITLALAEGGLLAVLRRAMPWVDRAAGAFLVLADLLARAVVRPIELPVGVVTALVGVPVFAALLRRGAA